MLYPPSEIGLAPSLTALSSVTAACGAQASHPGRARHRAQPSAGAADWTASALAQSLRGSRVWVVAYAFRNVHGSTALPGWFYRMRSAVKTTSSPRPLVSVELPAPSEASTMTSWNSGSGNTVFDDSRVRRRPIYDTGKYERSVFSCADPELPLSATVTALETR